MPYVKHPLLTIRPAMKRRYTKEMAPVMEAWQLNSMELDVLLFLGNNPGYDTASDMVQLRQLTKSHVSKAVETLTAKGLLAQQRDMCNRRRVHLLLLPAAQPILEAGQQAQQRFVDVLTRGFSQEDKAAMQRMLEMIARNAVEAE